MRVRAVDCVSLYVTDEQTDTRLIDHEIRRATSKLIRCAIWVCSDWNSLVATTCPDRRRSIRSSVSSCNHRITEPAEQPSRPRRERCCWRRAGRAQRRGAEGRDGACKHVRRAGTDSGLPRRRGWLVPTAAAAAAASSARSDRQHRRLSSLRCASSLVGRAGFDL